MVLVLYMQKLHSKLEHIVPREYSTMMKSNCNIQLLLQHQTLTHLLFSLKETSIGIRIYDSGRKICKYHNIQYSLWNSGMHLY